MKKLSAVMVTSLVFASLTYGQKVNKGAKTESKDTHLSQSGPSSTKKPGDATVTQKKDASATELLKAALANDADAVRKLINQGAPINAREGDDTVLSAACANKNLELARWLIKRGAEIDVLTFFVSDDNNHLPSFSVAEQEFVAYLVYTQLSRKGMRMTYPTSKAQIEFVKRIKEAIIENLRVIGPWPKDVKGWAVRFAYIDYVKADGATFLVRCDIAAWTERALFELATVTGRLFARPPSMSGGTHVWLEVIESSSTVILSTKFDKDKVLSGNFLITRKEPNILVAERVEAKK